jgi:molecular chaperone DnaK (HSP70)
LKEKVLLNIRSNLTGSVGPISESEIPDFLKASTKNKRRPELTCEQLEEIELLNKNFDELIENLESAADAFIHLKNYQNELWRIMDGRKTEA